MATGRIQDITPEGMALVKQAQEGEMDAVCDIIDSGKLPVDAKGLNEVTCLMMACSSGDDEMVHELLNRGANPNAQDFDGKNCLRYGLSVFSARPLVARALLDAGANMWAPDARGKPAIHYAQSLKYGDVMEVFTEYAAMPRLERAEDASKALLMQAEDGKSPLLHSPSTWHQWPQIIEALAQKGEHISKAELLAADASGVVPMERAIECRAFGAVCDALKAQGETLDVDDMLPDGKNSAGWVNALGKTRQMEQLFTPEMWEQHNVSSLTHVHGALDKSAQEQVHGLHVLRAAVSQAQREVRGR